MDPGSDLSQLPDLNIDVISQTIRDRFLQDKFYTNVGDILIAVNPCKEIPIYDQKHHEIYDWRDFKTDLPSHVFQVAARAYSRMRQKNANQVILVCGESGAGKTESTKHMVKHFMNMCPEDSGDLHDRIINVNPLLEAFGNAKTIMNDNSSRFAKFLELSFREDGQVIGGSIRDYMLEKSRVVNRTNDSGEGNFHIFYSLLAGMSQQQKMELNLQKPETYDILKGDINSLKKTQQYAQQYAEQMRVLRQIGMEEADIKVIHCLLAAVLHLTQIEFQETDKTSGQLKIKDQELVKFAADLLDTDYENLGHALISSTSKIAGEEIHCFKSLDQANDGRDALAKAIYERLFGWVVLKMNKNLHPNKLGSHENKAEIGILDIAGFEKLKVNSFETMCINLVNERLQNYMNKVVITQEEKIYKTEGIPLEDVKFKDNVDVIQLFEIKTGILPSLDEETRFQQGTDQNFVNRLMKNFKRDHPYHSLLTFPRGERPEFGIKHFAGVVWYSCHNFLEKNRDTLNKELESCMKQSLDPCIADIFTVRKGDTGTISNTLHNIRKSMKVAGLGQSRKPMTERGMKLAQELQDLGATLKNKFKVGKPTEIAYIPRDHKTVISYFQKSIQQLLAKMNQAEPYFVRCIKPNLQLAPDNFNEPMVKDQLKYNGVAEIAKIRKMGYSVRIQFDKFYARYKPLFSPAVTTPKEASRAILEAIIPRQYYQDFQLGKYTVFMKEHVNVILEKCYYVRQNVAAKIICKGVKLIVEKLRKARLEEERKKKEEELEKQRQKKEEERKRQQEEDKKEDLFQSKFNGGFRSSASEQDSSSDESMDTNDTNLGASQSSTASFNVNRLRGTRLPERFTGSGRDWNASSSSSGQSQQEIPSPPPTPPPPRKNKPKEEAVPLPKKETEFWDLFQIIPRETRGSDVHDARILRILKGITYFLLFIIFLGSLVIQKISLAALISGIRPKRNEQLDQNDMEDEVSARYLLALIAICAPYVLIMLTSIWKVMFGNQPFPAFGSIFVVMILETLHSVGLCLLVFSLLPDLGAVQGIMVLSAACIFPSFLKPFFSNNAEGSRGSCSGTICRIIEFVVDLLAFFVQLSAIPIVIIPHTQYLHAKDNYTIHEKLVDDESFIGFEHDDPIHIVKTVFALLLCSISWWENFVDDRICGSAEGCLKQALFKLKFDLQESRPYIFMFVSLWKIAFSFLFAWALMEEPAKFDFTKIGDVTSSDIRTYSDIVALTISALVGYYVAYTSCKLQMQKMTFSLPCLLSTPIAVLALSLQCAEHVDFLSVVSNNTLHTSCDTNIEDRWYHFLMGVVWLISMYWIGRHIWFSDQERLAKVERLFVNPLYCGILLEQHLVMNRRRHNRRITMRRTDDSVQYRMSKMDLKTGGSEEGEGLKSQIPPMIYACATLWHENRNEMVQLLKSLFRMDKDQFVRRKALEVSKHKDVNDLEYYEFEAHILFDDAFETNDDEERVPNPFVKLMASLMTEAASAVHSKPTEVKPPFMIPTHYGGQLVFQMPGGNFIFVHMKDKSKIRHRKRWSQVMYMYYLLGYRIVKECQERVLQGLADNDLSSLATWDQMNKEATGLAGKSQIFQLLDDEVIFRAENTFLLALDGDVDFTPGAVRLLLDRMKKNPRVGAACGRIHPIGNGPMVWYQKFEYAVAHWLQKATEHVLGCVLCSPGCFSMFRGSALMDDNVMRKYTILPSEASHHLMYDQGEDRWLCTLLLQQGYRVDYAAASDAYTYAPEGFDEYFNQRRRWTPSTIANIMDLLQDGKNTVASNNNISWLYIVYQAALMVSTIIGPATVLMMIAGALLTVFRVDLMISYVISMIPAILYFIACFVFKQKIQLILAQVLSAAYIFIMMVVFVGAIITAVTESPYHPSVLFLAGLVVIFLIAGLFHPQEWQNLIYGVLYFMWVPTGFLILIIYSLCNLHVVSWGTREVPKKKTKQELEEEERQKKEKEENKKKRSFWNFFTPSVDMMTTLLDKFSQPKQEDKLVSLLEKMNANLEKLNSKDGNEADESLKEVVVEEDKTNFTKSGKPKKSVHFAEKTEEKEAEEFDEDEYMYQKQKKKRDDLKNPAWTEMEEFAGGKVLDMADTEQDFWKGFVTKYLYPLDADKNKQEKDKKDLMELRNNVCAGMALINLLWIAINFMFQLRKPTVINFPLPGGKTEEDLGEETVEAVIKVDVMGLLFVLYFLLILLIQFIGMIVHRWGTFLHLIAITEIPNPCAKNIEAFSDPKREDAKRALDFCQQMLAEPMPDYSDDEDDDEFERKKAEDMIKNIQKTGTKDAAGQQPELGVSIRNTIIGRSSGRADNFSTHLSRSSRNRNTFQDQDFLRRSMVFLQDNRMKEKNENDLETGVRYRKKTAVDVGHTLPPNEARKGTRRFGATSVVQRNLLERMTTDTHINRNLNFDLGTSRRYDHGASNSLGHSYRGGDIDEEEDIYDEIPAAGTLGKAWAKKMKMFSKSENSNGRKRHSGFEQWT